MNYEKTLDKFIEKEKTKARIGSEDDYFHECQIVKYIETQRKFWIDFAKFIKKELKKKEE